LPPPTQIVTPFEDRQVKAEDSTDQAWPGLTNQHHVTEAVPEIEAPAVVKSPVENEAEEVYENLSTRHESGLVSDGFRDNDQPAVVDNKNEVAAETAPVAEQPYVEPVQQQPGRYIADETFDEIVGIEDINIKPGADQPLAVTNEEPRAPVEKAAPVTPNVRVADEFIKDNIASKDFFMFDRAFGRQKPAGQAGSMPHQSWGGTNKTSQVNNTPGDDADHQDVSKYHDEKMPYTFMWWLDKTRKEHAGLYQPYVKSDVPTFNSKPKRAADELQQQYFENIFHITSVDELDKAAPPPAAPHNIKRKEQLIIERFIKEEPQIKPQSSDKLDNENKAKKSSEDRDELVTETLAAIYSEQMLYHKAIASYKKLMLKFPEKSRYFAGKIEQLEKKTN